MGKLRGFLEISRAEADVARRSTSALRDWREFELPLPEPSCAIRARAAWTAASRSATTAVRSGTSSPTGTITSTAAAATTALRALHATNNFPEVTGRVCPAPCEASCVLNLEKEPVTIKTIERAIIDRAFERGRARAACRRRRAPASAWPSSARGRRAWPRRSSWRARGHDVTVLETDDRIGGLLRYGIPDFKLEKDVIDRRLEQMRAEGVTLPRPASHVRRRRHAATSCAREYDAVVLAGGATKPRDLPVPGRELDGVHFAMEFLTQQNRRVAGRRRRRRRSDPRHRQARRRARRRRHRLRLRRHVAPPGRGAA